MPAFDAHATDSHVPLIDRLAHAALPVGQGTVVGHAASVEAQSGDPEIVTVWTQGAVPWRIDRRSARMVVAGEPPLDGVLASHVADLVDRAQLALGFPVEIDWGVADGVPVIVRVAPLRIAPRFTHDEYRRISLLHEDGGIVASLAVDAMARAMRATDSDAFDENVKRVYGRAYRRVPAIDRVSAFDLPPSRSAPLVLTRVSRLLRNIASPLIEAERYTRGIEARLSALDAVPVRELDRRALAAHLSDCERAAVEAYALLDRVRRATGATLPVLETLTGAPAREELSRLGAPRVSEHRRRLVERVQRLGARVVLPTGVIPSPRTLAPAHRAAWDAVRVLVQSERDLGLDVRPAAWGADDDAFHAAVQSLRTLDLDAVERQRHETLAALGARARNQSGGLGREAALSACAVLIKRFAVAKGELADALAWSLLRLRRAALEVGARLADDSVLDDAPDALSLGVSELQEALLGEPGAYAARVRMRCEDDERWQAFAPPDRLLPSDLTSS